ncbi:hypothetical protein ACQZ6F_27775 [Rhizobium sp. A22-96]
MPRGYVLSMGVSNDGSDDGLFADILAGGGIDDLSAREDGGFIADSEDFVELTPRRMCCNGAGKRMMFDRGVVTSTGRFGLMPRNTAKNVKGTLPPKQIRPKMVR